MRFATGSRLGPYEIVAPLGEGGMGEVYRAIDKRLARPVAIKILSARLTENRRAMSRFEREARAIAALTHPNVLSIFEFDVEGETPFVVTELLEGVTLRQRMAARIPWRKAAELGAAIADGLAAAHARGITHRDLKPENVFITYDGRVKILDFGIAHVNEGVGEAQRVPSDTEPTAEYRADAPLGTVGYVSPEQIRMKEPEPTSDIFSLGVILYEMIAGANPFARGTTTETLAAILNDEPEPLRARADVPEALEHLVIRCLEKNPGQRAQSAHDLADLLRETLRTRDPSRPRRARIIRAAAATVTLVAAFAAFLYLNGRNGFAPKGASATQAVTTIAILPLVNATGDPNLEYVSDGITEGLINQLSELPNLRVTARPTVFRFKGKATDPVAVGKQLDVQAIATGKIAVREGALQVQADLIDTRSGTQVWGGAFDAERKARASLPRRVAREIARELKVKLTRSQTLRLAGHDKTDPTAFDLFLRGRDYLNTETRDGRARAIALLEESVATDPEFARAHAALAEAYVRSSNAAEPRVMFAKARGATSRALALDPALAEAHLALGIVHYWADWNFAGAEREFRRSLELSPSLASANAYYSDLLLSIGDVDGAVEQAHRARELDPLSRGSAISLIAAYLFGGEYDEARREIARLLRTDPDYAVSYFLNARLLHLTGNSAAACREYVRADEFWGKPADQVKSRTAACGKGGVAEYNREVIRQTAADPAADPFYVASLYAELGDVENTLRFLERGYEKRTSGMLLIKTDPSFARVRDDPRFAEMIRRVGLDGPRAQPAGAAELHDRGGQSSDG